MATNPEGEYEDSYQKEEKLRQELKSLLSETRYFLESGKKSLKEIGELPEKLRSISEEIEELNKAERTLKSELDKMKADLKNSLI